MGRIRGTVRDPLQAAIPQAAVKALQTATGAERTSKTNDAGLSSFPALPIGAYNVTIEVLRRQKDGWSYQFFYTLSNNFRSGGNGWRDTAVPHHWLRWNWLVDLPLGRGKEWGGSVSPMMDKLIGGWQLAGTGAYRSSSWTLPTGNWGDLGDIGICGTKRRIEDCRSGTCIPGCLYWNGYIPANRINSRDASGKPNGVMDVPDDYKPAHLPIHPTPKEGVAANAPMAPCYESNNVWIPLKNGTVQRVGMDTSCHPWRQQYLPGPWNFGVDASIFKTVRFCERMALRMNADFFNVLNNPGMGLPNSTIGIISLQNSSNGPRQLQLKLRLSW